MFFEDSPGYKSIWGEVTVGSVDRITAVVPSYRGKPIKDFRTTSDL